MPRLDKKRFTGFLVDRGRKKLRPASPGIRAAVTPGGRFAGTASYQAGPASYQARSAFPNQRGRFPSALALQPPAPSICRRMEGAGGASFIEKQRSIRPVARPAVTFKAISARARITRSAICPSGVRIVRLRPPRTSACCRAVKSAPRPAPVRPYPPAPT